MLRLIVFDCDGVMFDSRAANIAYYNAILQHFGCSPMSPEEEDYVHMHSVNLCMQHIFRNRPDITTQEIDSVRKSLTYDPFLRYMTMEPDLREFLDLTFQKYHLAISTNRTNTMVPLLKQYDLVDYFGIVMTAATAPRPKPAPDGLLEILNHYDCQANEALFIGDSILDEQHATACGVPLIAFRSPELKAAYHVQNFMQILTLPPLQDTIA